MITRTRTIKSRGKEYKYDYVSIKVANSKSKKNLDTLNVAKAKLEERLGDNEMSYLDFLLFWCRYILEGREIE